MSGLHCPIEQKFVFRPAHANAVHEWLSHAYLPDGNHPGSTVSSIYYDTPALDLYYEKRNSDYMKAKVRLRWYTNAGELDTAEQISAFLEVKRKVGCVRYKNRIPITVPRDSVAHEPLLDKEIRDVPGRLGELGYFAPGLLLPTILIRYERRRFVDPQTRSRIALDTHIHCTHVNAACIPRVGTYSLDLGVLEIKGTTSELLGSLGPIRQLLTREALSKYGRCCEHIMQPIARRV